MRTIQLSNLSSSRERERKRERDKDRNMACTSNESSTIHQPLKPVLTLYQNPNQLTINVDLNENFKLLDFCRVFRESIRNVASNYRRQLIICWLKSDVRKSILWHLLENVYHYLYLNSTLHNISLLRQV